MYGKQRWPQVLILKENRDSIGRILETATAANQQQYSHKQKGLLEKGGHYPQNLKIALNATNLFSTIFKLFKYFRCKKFRPL